jgi:8-oxo-dGTP pyrophosphatase MutT (NUDIX family)
LEPEEEPLHAGVRELMEETGYVGDATYMGSLPYSPYSSGRRHCVLVINAKQVDTQHLDPNEFLTVLKMPLRDFRNKIKSGSIRGWDLGYRALDYLGKL